MNSPSIQNVEKIFPAVKWDGEWILDFLKSIPNKKMQINDEFKEFFEKYFKTNRECFVLSDEGSVLSEFGEEYGIYKIDCNGIYFPEEKKDEKIKELERIIIEKFYDERYFGSLFQYFSKNKNILNARTDRSGKTEFFLNYRKNYKEGEEKESSDMYFKNFRFSFLIRRTLKYEGEQKNVVDDLYNEFILKENRILLRRNIFFKYLNSLNSFFKNRKIPYNENIIKELAALLEKRNDRVTDAFALSFFKTLPFALMYENIPETVLMEEDRMRSVVEIFVSQNEDISLETNALLLRYTEKKYLDRIKKVFVKEMPEAGNTGEKKINSFVYRIEKLYVILNSLLLAHKENESIEDVSTDFLKKIRKFSYVRILGSLLAVVYFLDGKTETGEKFSESVFGLFNDYRDFLIKTGRENTKVTLEDILKYSLDETENEEIKNLAARLIKRSAALIRKTVENKNFKNTVEALKDISGEKPAIEEVLTSFFHTLKEEKFYIEYSVFKQTLSDRLPIREKDPGENRLFVEIVFRPEYSVSSFKEKEEISEEAELFIKEEECPDMAVLNVGDFSGFHSTNTGEEETGFSDLIRTFFLLEEKQKKKALVNILEEVFESETSFGVFAAFTALILGFILKKRTKETKKPVSLLTLFDADIEEGEDTLMARLKKYLNDIGYTIPVVTKGLKKRDNNNIYQERSTLLGMINGFAHKKVYFKIDNYPYLKRDMGRFLESLGEKGINFLNVNLIFYSENSLVLKNRENFSVFRPENGKFYLALAEYFNITVSKSDKKGFDYSYERGPVKKKILFFDERDRDRIVSQDADFLESESFYRHFVKEDSEEIPISFVKVKPSSSLRIVEVEKIIKKNSDNYYLGEDGMELRGSYVSVLNIKKSLLSAEFRDTLMKNAFLLKDGKTKSYIYLPKIEKHLKQGMYNRHIDILYPYKFIDSELKCFVEDLDRLIVLGDGSRKKTRGREYAFSLSFLGDLNATSFDRRNNTVKGYSVGNEEIDELNVLVGLIFNNICSIERKN